MSNDSVAQVHPPPSIGPSPADVWPRSLYPPYGGAEAPPEGPPRAERGGVPEGPPLDSSYVHSHPSEISVSFREFGEGITKATWSTYMEANIVPKGKRGESENMEANREMAVRRAKGRLFDLIVMAKADHLLTLTYRENLQDRRRAVQYLRKFLKKVRKALPDAVWVAVFELQRRGAIHHHLAVRGRQDVRLLRALWLSVVGAGGGNIDVQGPKGNVGAATWDRVRLARYMSKYMGKELALYEFNKKSYWHSGNISEPIVTKVVFEGGADMARRVVEFMEASGLSVKRVWESEGKKFGCVSTY